MIIVDNTQGRTVFDWAEHQKTYPARATPDEIVIEWLRGNENWIEGAFPGQNVAGILLQLTEAGLLASFPLGYTGLKGAVYERVDELAKAGE